MDLLVPCPIIPPRKCFSTLLAFVVPDSFVAVDMISQNKLARE